LGSGICCDPGYRNLYRYCPDTNEWQAYCNFDPTCSTVTPTPIISPTPIPIPNCKNLTCPAEITLGETGTFTAEYEDYTGPLTSEALAIFNEATCSDAVYWKKYDDAVEGIKTFDWTPAAVGTYDVDCRAWNDAITECRGRCVTGPPIYACFGPNTSCQVEVVAPPCEIKANDVDFTGVGDTKLALVNVVDPGTGIDTYNSTFAP
jgi:hypothetical protein